MAFTETGLWERIVLHGDRMPALQEHTVIVYKVFADIVPLLLCL